MHEPFEEHTLNQAGHHTFYLAAGPPAGPLLIFVHGWPELSLSWRHQLRAAAALGFRAIAPDMRGYGGSDVYPTHGDYAQSLFVSDMLNLLDSLGAERAIWIGHDWGAATVWCIASHHPQRCHGVANLCVPYYTLERGLDACVALVNREIYPIADYPAGQWEYQLFYEEQFAAAQAEMEANAYNTVKLLFRKGNPDGFGLPAGTAMTRRNGGWFGGSGSAPDLPIDADVISAGELSVYADSLEENGFFGPNSVYMNHAANAAYAEDVVNGGYLDMPVLFLAAQYDYTCDCINSQLAAPLQARCRQLTQKLVYSGHWMAQERPLDVNAALFGWLARQHPELWPTSLESGVG